MVFNDKSDKKLTCAGHSSIFTMGTVVTSKLIARTVDQLMLKTSALDIIQEDGTTTLTKVSSVWEGKGGERERERERESI